jgi:hypothetical protein
VTYSPRKKMLAIELKIKKIEAPGTKNVYISTSQREEKITLRERLACTAELVFIEENISSRRLRKNKSAG